MILIGFLNFIYWPIVQLVIAKWVLRSRWQSWNLNGLFFSSWSWESLAVYQIFAIRRWKRYLPDGARWMGSDFRKDGSSLRENLQIERFISETCRAEFAHVIMLAFAPIPFLWNPAWAGWVMFGFGVFVNLPCILAQRYHRLRLRFMLLRRSSKFLKT